MIIVLICLIAQSFQLEEYECSLNIDSLCAPGMKIRPKYYGYFGFWNFEMDKQVDMGPHNHITNVDQLNRTPSMVGTGVSFQKESKFEVLFVPSFEGTQWTFSFQIMFEEIGRKITNIGNFLQLSDNIDDPQNTLKIQLDTQQQSLIIMENQESIKANMKLQARLWYYIFIVKSDQTIKILINGIECGQFSSKKAISYKKLTIQLENEIPSFVMDTIKFYNNKLSDWEILAASQIFQQNSDWIIMQCEQCTFDKAKQCPYNFHLCSTIELYSFAINIAKNMGWGVANNTNIWSSESNPKKYKEKEGLGLCCRDIDYIQV